MQRFALLLTGIMALELSAACSSLAPRAARAAKPPASPPQVPAQSPASSSCAGRGPMACDTPPTSAEPDELCAHLTQCMRGRDGELGKILLVHTCERLENVQSTSDSSGVSSIGFVAAFILHEDDGDSLSTYYPAYYFFAQLRDSRWCMVDQVFEPTRIPSYAEMQSTVDLKPSAEPGTLQLALLSERIGHDSVGQEETEEGVGLYLQQCIASHYTFSNGRFEKTQSAEKLEACNAAAQGPEADP